MPFTRRQDIQTLIEQTGIETSPAGLTQSDDAITETSTGTGASLYTTINMGAFRFLISGTLTIDPLSYSILTDYDVALDRGATAIIVNGTLNIGITTVSNGDTSRSVGNAMYHAGQSGNGFDTYSLDVRSGGTLNINGGLLRLTGTLNVASGGNLVANNCNIVGTGARQLRLRNPVSMQNVTVYNSPILIYEAPTIFTNVTVINATTPIGSTRNPFSFLVYGADSGGTGNFSNNTGLTVTEGLVSVGGINDYGLLDSCNWLLRNIPIGSSARVVSWLISEGAIQRRRGYLRIAKQLDIRIFDINGNRVSMAVYFSRDTNNGNRQDGSATIGFNDTADLIYTGSIQATGSNIIQVITAKFNKHDGNEAGGIAPLDRRGIDAIDTFEFNLWDYRFNRVVVSPSCLGLGILTVFGFALPDTSITNLNPTEVLAYTGIVIDHTNQQIVLSRTGNVPIEEIVDFAKMDKLVNVEIPTVRTLIYTVFGTEVRTSYNLVINDGTTLTGTSKYNAFRTTGTISGLNNVDATATVFDSTFDSNGIITLPTVADTVEGYMTEQDANNANTVNALFTGVRFRYNSSTFGGTTIFLRATDSNDSTTLLIRGQLIPVEAGTHPFLALAFGENQQLTRLLELSTEILANQGNQQVTISQADIVSGVHTAIRTTEPIATRELAQENSLQWINEQIRCQVFPFILFGYFASNNQESGIGDTGSFTNTYTAVTTDNTTGNIVVVTRTGVGDGRAVGVTGFNYSQHSDAIDYTSRRPRGTEFSIAIDFQITGSAERNAENQMVINEEIMDITIQATPNSQRVVRNVRIDGTSRAVVFDLGAISGSIVNIFSVVVFFQMDSNITQFTFSKIRLVTKEMVLQDLFTESLTLNTLNSSLTTALSVTNYDNATRGSIADKLSKTRDSVNPFFASSILNVRLLTPVATNPADSFSASIRFEDGEEVITITKTDADARDDFNLFFVSNTVTVTKLDTFSMSIRILNAPTLDPHEIISLLPIFADGVRAGVVPPVSVSRDTKVVDFRITDSEARTTSLERIIIDSTGQNLWTQLELRGFKLGRRIDLLQAVKEGTRHVVQVEEPDKYTDNSLYGIASEIKRELFPFDKVASLNLVARQFVPVNPEDNFTVSVLNDEVNIWRSGGTDDTVTVFFSGQPFRLTRNQTISMAVQILSSTQSDITTEDLRFTLRTSEGSDETLEFTEEAFVGGTNIDVAFITGLSRETISVNQLEIRVLNDIANEWLHIRCVFGVFQTDRVSQLIRTNATAIAEVQRGVSVLDGTDTGRIIAN